MQDLTIKSDRVFLCSQATIMTSVAPIDSRDQCQDDGQPTHQTSSEGEGIRQAYQPPASVSECGGINSYSQGMHRPSYVAQQYPQQLQYGQYPQQLQYPPQYPQQLQPYPNAGQYPSAQYRSDSVSGGSHVVVVQQPPTQVAQPNPESFLSQIVTSCFTFWCCWGLLGGIAFIFASMPNVYHFLCILRWSTATTFKSELRWLLLSSLACNLDSNLFHSGFRVGKT